MLKEILSNLNEIESTHQVKIIYACESGSRAWGFASKDSDYDVRFIYVRKDKEYLRLDKTRDVIEWKLDEVLDINGWDISKALRLLKESNPTLLEWLNSPIVYKEEKDIEGLKELLPKYFSEKKSLYHYLSMARNTYENYCLEDKVKLKKYFYVIRPILASKCIINKHTTPPVLFDTLVESELEDSLKDVINELVNKKKDMEEVGYIDKNLLLDEYINRELKNIEDYAASVDNNKTGWDDINEYFYDLIRANIK